MVAAVEALEPLRGELFEAQTERGLLRLNDCLLVDLRLAGIVQAWAAGAGWQQIMQARLRCKCTTWFGAGIALVLGYLSLDML